MTVYRADVRLPYETGLPRDLAINTYHFEIPGAIISGPQLDAIVQALEDFYSTDATGASESPGGYLSPFIDRDLCEVHVYHVGVEGPPVRVQSIAVQDALAGTSLPFEVAVCGSYYAQPVTGISPRSLRGRVYYGPLVSTTMNATSGEPSIPSAAVIAAIGGAQFDLATSSSLGAADVSWVVYSRVLGSAHVVSGGWVDNEFDTQRRRQVDATARVGWLA